MNGQQHRTFLCSLLIGLVSMATARGEVRLAGIFSDHMVLQRDRHTAVWGWANPGEAVTVVFAGQKMDATADSKGRWRLALQPMAASAEGRDLRVSAGQSNIAVHDLLVGDVWHASGQSNMAMTGGKVPLLAPLIAEADFPLIRVCRIPGRSAREPIEDVAGRVEWKICSPTTAGSFSAAAIFFARRIHKEIGVPVGIVDTSRGGQPIETFIPREAFANHPTLVREGELGDKEDLAGIWHLPGGVRARSADWLPGRDYNAIVAPITPFTLRGFIWYQGESNSGDGEDPRDYRLKMGALVSGWRNAFQQGELPFFFVQLPGSGAGPGWPYLREQQRLSLDLPKIGMVVTIDLEGSGIHPPNKFDVGQRLAALALAKEYGKTVPCEGPVFDKAEIASPGLTIHFSHADEGLMAGDKNGLDAPQEKADAAIKLFEVADESGNWTRAAAKIVGRAVVVQSETVKHPVAVRYAYEKTPAGPFLYNRQGLPAAPFCSRPELLKYEPGMPKDGAKR